MFKNMMEQVKKHPYLIGGAVLGLVILLWLSSRSSGSAASSGTTIVATQPTVDPPLREAVKVAPIVGATVRVVANCNVADPFEKFGMIT